MDKTPSDTCRQIIAKTIGIGNIYGKFLRPIGPKMLVIYVIHINIATTIISCRSSNDRLAKSLCKSIVQQVLIRDQSRERIESRSYHSMVIRHKGILGRIVEHTESIRAGGHTTKTQRGSTSIRGIRQERHCRCDGTGLHGLRLRRQGGAQEKHYSEKNSFCFHNKLFLRSNYSKLKYIF